MGVQRNAKKVAGGKTPSDNVPITRLHVGQEWVTKKAIDKTVGVRKGSTPPGHHNRLRGR